MNNDEFYQGLRDIAPMTIAYAPIAALWGTVAASKGLTPLEAVLMSVGLYSGAAQFVAMDLWNTGIPLLMLVFTIATVSLRHVLMSASIARHIASFPKARASVLLFWLTDEAWAMLERRALTKPLTPSYFLGVGFPLWPNWFFFTGIGAWFGSGIGREDTLRFGLDFAFAAMFIAVVAGFWKGTGTAMILVASSLAAVTGKLILPGAWYILAGGAAGMLVAYLTYREQPA